MLAFDLERKCERLRLFPLPLSHVPLVRSFERALICLPLTSNESVKGCAYPRNDSLFSLSLRRRCNRLWQSPNLTANEITTSSSQRAMLLQPPLKSSGFLCKRLLLFPKISSTIFGSPVYALLVMTSGGHCALSCHCEGGVTACNPPTLRKKAALDVQSRFRLS